MLSNKYLYPSVTYKDCPTKITYILCSTVLADCMGASYVLKS